MLPILGMQRCWGEVTEETGDEILYAEQPSLRKFCQIPYVAASAGEIRAKKDVDRITRKEDLINLLEGFYIRRLLPLWAMNHGDTMQESDLTQNRSGPDISSRSFFCIFNKTLIQIQQL